jgi:hypothetical protein
MWLHFELPNPNHQSLMMQLISISSSLQAGMDSSPLIHAAMERIRQLEAEVHRLKNKAMPPERYIRVFEANRLIKVACPEILMIRAESNYSHLLLKNGDRYFTSRTLKSWASELSPDDFLRCHRSYLVNKHEIAGIDRGTHTIIMRDGAQVPTSRRYQSSSVETVFTHHDAAHHRTDSKPDCTVHKLKHSIR